MLVVGALYGNILKTIVLHMLKGYIVRCVNYINKDMFKKHEWDCRMWKLIQFHNIKQSVSHLLSLFLFEGNETHLRNKFFRAILLRIIEYSLTSQSDWWSINISQIFIPFSCHSCLFRTSSKITENVARMKIINKVLQIFYQI